LLDRDPLLRNLIEKKTNMGRLESVADMRSATTTLEQAIAMMRTPAPPRIDLERATIQMAVRTFPKGSVIKQDDLERARAEMMKPSVEIPKSDYFGFPKGTRMISVSTFSLHQLLLAKVDGKLRIVWAFPLGD